MASNVAQGSTRLILIGAAVLLSIGMGLRQSIGLFLTPVTRDLALTAADFTLTIAIQNIVWGLAQAPAVAAQRTISAGWPIAPVHPSLPYKWHRMWRKDRPG